MKTTKTITVDLVNSGIPAAIDVMQCDSNTRAVAVALYASGVPWNPPAGATASVAFRKPDNTSGWYDTLPDGSEACEVAENVVTATLAPEMLTAAGHVSTAIVFQDENLNQLATFPFVVVVHKNPAAGNVISNSYYNLQTLAEINAAFDYITKTIANEVLYIQQELTEAQKAQARQNIGAATVDDTSLGNAAWSSRNIVDKLCPELCESGGVVTCRPVEGYPLGVVSQILPVQAGSGVPYPPGGGKNLVKYPYENTSMTLNGITFTDNGDGTVTANGTATANAVFSIYAENESIWPGVVPGETYTVSLSYEGGYVGGNPSFVLAYYQAGDGMSDYSGWMSALIGRSNTSVAPADMVGIRSYLIITSGTTVANLVLKPQLEEGDTATAYAPYSNIRPISGWTGSKLWRGGKNLLGGDALADRLVNLGATKDVTAGTVQWKPSNVNRGVSFYDHFKENTQYTFIFYGRNDSGGTSVSVRFEYTDGGALYMRGLSAEDGYYAFTSQIGKTVEQISLVWIDDNGPTVMYYDQCGIFEGVVAVEDFEPYRGEEFTIDFGQTVYGGSLDRKTGVLTVDRVTKKLFGDGTDDINVDVPDIELAVTRVILNEAITLAEAQGSVCTHISSHFAPYDGEYSANVPIWSIGGVPQFAGCWLYCDSSVVGTTLESVNAWLQAENEAGTAVQVSYKLAEPATIQLAPQEILALEGVNTLYSDTGDTTVTGRADPRPMLEEQKTIQERLAALEAAAVNNT